MCCSIAVALLFLAAIPSAAAKSRSGEFDAVSIAAYLTDVLPTLEARRPSDIVEWCAEDAGQYTRPAAAIRGSLNYSRLKPSWKMRRRERGNVRSGIRRADHLEHWTRCR